MGETVSKVQNSVTCAKFDELLPPPRFHFKSRYHIEDEYCETAVYTRTKDTIRFSVPREKIKWNISMSEYNPSNFTSAKILNDVLDWKDPNM